MDVDHPDFYIVVPPEHREDPDEALVQQLAASGVNDQPRRIISGIRRNRRSYRQKKNEDPTYFRNLRRQVSTYLKAL